MVSSKNDRTAVETGLKPEATEQVSQLLNVYLADLHVLYTKLHNFHWNVTGESFFSLHQALETEYESVAEEIDDVAERILQVGHRPLASLEQYGRAAKLHEIESRAYSGREIAETLITDYNTLIDELRHLIKTAGEYGDDGSADEATGWLKSKEKFNWMISAYRA